jgi:hypothetical protein
VKKVLGLIDGEEFQRIFSLKQFMSLNERSCFGQTGKAEKIFLK